MATTGRQVFSAAILLLDYQHKTSGEVVTGKNLELQRRAAGLEEYAPDGSKQQKTIGIINQRVMGLYRYSGRTPYSDARPEAAEGERMLPVTLANWDEPVDLDDMLAQWILPVGVAMDLVRPMDRELYLLLRQEYYDRLTGLGDDIVQGTMRIRDVYGGIEHGEFGLW